jgi:hypothetical protein
MEQRAIGQEVVINGDGLQEVSQAVVQLFEKSFGPEVGFRTVFEWQTTEELWLW